MAQVQLVKCSFEGCDYQGKPGHVKLHEEKKHGTNSRDNNFKQTAKTENEKNAKDGAIKCPECKGTKFTALNSRIGWQKMAMGEGYTKICKHCEEVI